MGRCKAPDCKPEVPLQPWAAEHGLEQVQSETTKQHALRCVAYITGLGGPAKVVQKVAAAVEGVPMVVEPAAEPMPVPEPEPPEIDDWLASVPPLSVDEDSREQDIPQVDPETA